MRRDKEENANRKCGCGNRGGDYNNEGCGGDGKVGEHGNEECSGDETVTENGNKEGLETKVKAKQLFISSKQSILIFFRITSTNDINFSSFFQKKKGRQAWLFIDIVNCFCFHVIEIFYCNFNYLLLHSL